MLEESTDSDLTITYEGVASSPRQDSAEEGVRFDVDRNETKENPSLEESTDSDFTITYEGVLGSPGLDNEEAGARLDTDMSEDSVAPGTSNDEEETSGGKRLSPRQRHRRQSLARFKRKKWGEEWII